MPSLALHDASCVTRPAPWAGSARLCRGCDATGSRLTTTLPFAAQVASCVPSACMLPASPLSCVSVPVARVSTATPLRHHTSHRTAWSGRSACAVACELALAPPPAYATSAWRTSASLAAKLRSAAADPRHWFPGRWLARRRVERVQDPLSPRPPGVLQYARARAPLHPHRQGASLPEAEAEAEAAGAEESRFER